MTEYSEKRDFQRMSLDSSLEYQIENDTNTYQGTVKNLSAKGVLFASEKAVEVGKNVIIKLTPVNNITPPMSADVNITRCDKISDSEFDVAGSILQIK